MKRRTIRIPTPSQAGLISLVTLHLFVMLVLSTLGISVAFATPTLSAIALSYSIARNLGYKGKALEIGFGTKPAPKPPTEPAKRLPLAFPPEPGQCYICGLFDDGRRKLVTGSAAHYSCEEWLGKWEPPKWHIRVATKPIELPIPSNHGVVYTHSSGFSTHTCDGWFTREELYTYCREKFSRYELISAYRGEEPAITLHHLNKEKA